MSALAYKQAVIVLQYRSRVDGGKESLPGCLTLKYMYMYMYVAYDKATFLLKYSTKCTHLYTMLKADLHTFPVPGGPAKRIALPAIFLDLISSTTTPAA